MKTKRFIILCMVLFLGSFIVFSCKIRGKGDVVSKTFQLSAFSSVTCKTEADVYITPAPAQSLTIEAQSNIIDNVTLEVEDGRLTIDEKKPLGKHEPILIRISMTELSNLVLDGSGNLFTTSTFESAGNVSAVINGSGNIDARINTPSIISTEINGSGDIILTGVAPKQQISINGSGEIHAFNLLTHITDISISGSGTCQVNADSLLYVNITGSGDVYFKGNPDISSNITGSGTIHNAN